MKYPGVFCISLDFELHWGCFERMQLNEEEQQYFLNTREVIPRKLDLFAANDVEATWAIVGSLYRKSVTDWKQNLPEVIPTFTHRRASAYAWIEDNGFKGEHDPFHFAPDLVKLVGETPHQEVATHTYAHYFCLEPGQTREQFRADMKMAVEVARAQGHEIRSLVFPRNQFNRDYLSVCSEVGITTVRSSPDIWYWKYATGSTFKEKFFRAGDAYIKMHPIKPVSLKDINTKTDGPLLIPSTRLYRAWQPKYKIQNRFKLRRILNEMTEAARKNYYYHIWWHPHNFGHHPDECMRELEQIVLHFKKLEKKYGFRTMHMQHINRFLLNQQ